MIFTADDQLELQKIYSLIRTEYLVYKQKYSGILSSVHSNHRLKADRFLNFLVLKKQVNELDIIFSKYGLQTSDYNILLEKFGSEPADKKPEGIVSCSKISPVLVNIKDESINSHIHLLPIIESGISTFRINCAFGKHEEWKKMQNNLLKASGLCEKDCTLLFDLAGQKTRIISITDCKGNKLENIRIRKNELLNLGVSEYSKDMESTYLQIGSPENHQLPVEGERVRFDDSKVEAIVSSRTDQNIQIKVIKTSGSGVFLTPGKGVNFPDLKQSSSALTLKDKSDLSFAIRNGDIISFSFTNDQADIDLYHREIKNLSKKSPPVVIKIETQQAVDQLEEILLSCYQFEDVSILLARGDLVSEMGFEQLPAIQKKIVEFTRYAGLPLIIATDVLENLNQNGVPSRSETIDADIALRAEHILLNQGEFTVECIDLLKELRKKSK